MSNSLYISANCVISKHAVIKNNKLIFQNEGFDVNICLLSIYQSLDVKYPKFYKMDHLSKLGWLAAEVLLADGFKNRNYHPEEIGIVLSNASSSLDTDIRYFETLKDIASPAMFVYTLPNILVGEICIRHNIKGESAFFISEQFDSALIHQYVRSLFDNQQLQSCICGWVELFGNDFKAALYLIERKDQIQKIDSVQNKQFTTENIHKIYHLEYGEINV